MDEGRSILIVDSNVGFATMLQESLEREGDYRVIVAHKGSEALNIASTEVFDLAIVDLGIDNVDGFDGATVARRLRQEQRHLRLVLIPLQGDVLPGEMADLDVQSVLPKPFFLPDLPHLIEEALSRPVHESGQPADAAVPPSGPGDRSVMVVDPLEMPYECPQEALRELEILARETNADAVLLTCEGRILSSVGTVSSEALEQLARAIGESYHSSRRIAEALEREPHRFEQSLEGDQHILYSLTIIDAVILSAALPTHVPLGIVRHRVRAAAAQLRHLASATQ